MDGGEHDVDRYTIIEIGDATRIIVDEGSPSPHIKVTLYRLLNTALVSAFGLSKAILAYKGESIAPTTLELIMGVIVGNLYDFYYRLCVCVGIECCSQALVAGLWRKY
jgi:hypothetical protein